MGFVKFDFFHFPEDEDCMTVNNERCVFPFRYQDKIYHRCMVRHGHPQPMCPTKVLLREQRYAYHLSWQECKKGCDGLNDEGLKACKLEFLKYQ